MGRLSCARRTSCLPSFRCRFPRPASSLRRLRASVTRYPKSAALVRSLGLCCRVPVRVRYFLLPVPSLYSDRSQQRVFSAPVRRRRLRYSPLRGPLAYAMLSVFVAAVLVVVFRRSRTRRPGFRLRTSQQQLCRRLRSPRRRRPPIGSSVAPARSFFVGSSCLVSCLRCVVRSVRFSRRVAVWVHGILIPRSFCRHFRVSRPCLAPPLSRRRSPFRRPLPASRFDLDARYPRSGSYLARRSLARLVA